VQFEQRLDAFFAFAREHEVEITALGPGNSGRHFYLLQHAENFVEVTLSSMGGISVSTEQGMGSQGRISPRLLAWLEREGLRYEDGMPFSDAARDYLSGDATRPVAYHVPQLRRQGAKACAGEGIPRVRQLLPAQPGWCAVYALAPAPPHGDGFEMRPLIGWALLDDEPLPAGDRYVPSVAALFVWTAADRGSAPDAGPDFVDEQDGFLGYAFPGCTIDWNERAEMHRKSYWDEERESWKSD
jgi:hypothetical protein